MGGNGAYFNSRLGLGRLIKKEWHRVATIRGIGVLEKNDPNSSVSLPTQSAKPNSVYAIFKKDGTLKQITEYGSDRKITRQTDFDHDHGKGAPHAHKFIDGLRVGDVITKGDLDSKRRLENWRSRTTRRF